MLLRPSFTRHIRVSLDMLFVFHVLAFLRYKNRCCQLLLVCELILCFHYKGGVPITVSWLIVLISPRLSLPNSAITMPAKKSSASKSKASTVPPPRRGRPPAKGKVLKSKEFIDDEVEEENDTYVFSMFC